jgi:REP element-mobilizing transposase RayT
MANVGQDGDDHAHLPRLAPEAYLGSAAVHWIMATDNRATGWLSDLFHARFRELLLHMSVLYHVLVPVYCLMPDHVHVLLVGIAPEADQKKAIAFLRRHLNALLKCQQDTALQKQAYDHVLKKTEREHDAFRAIAFYILENPVRKGLVESADRWPFSGCVVAGHPGWMVSHAEYWNGVWGIFQKSWEKEPQ